MSVWGVGAFALFYIALLFAVAYYGDQRSLRRGGPPKSQPWIYSLSLAVYCTSWTLFGSVGRAAQSGLDFLPIYLGPLIVLFFMWGMVRKIVRISKAQNITSIADFIGARYGKSQFLAAIVTLITIIGITPYIALQLKAIITGFDALVSFPEATSGLGQGHWWSDSALWLAVFMAIFSILFGARNIDATEHHEGMILAVAFESVVKLLAFLSVGIFVTWGVFDGLDHITSIVQDPAFSAPMGTSSSWVGWATVTVLSMAAFVILPRQYHVLVVENNAETELKRAVWVIPVYLVLINLFVVPIAIGGLYTLGPDVNPDLYVLTVPLSSGYPFLALFAYIGGLSAATGMIVVAAVAMATMVSNDMIMPLLLRSRRLRLEQSSDLTQLILNIRRGSIVAILLLSWVYYRIISENYALSTIGLMSFAAAIQFAPGVVAGLYWRRGTRWGVAAGLIGGFVVWLDALLLPSFGFDPKIVQQVLNAGLDTIRIVEPETWLAISGVDPFSEGVIWSLVVNVGLLILVSYLTPLPALERFQAEAFVNPLVEKRTLGPNKTATVSVAEIRSLLDRFMGMAQADRLFQEYQAATHYDLLPMQRANLDLLDFAEKALSGVIGASSARVVVASIVGGVNLRREEVAVILSDASDAIRHNRDLLQTAMDTVQQGILTFDDEDRLILWNRTFLEIFNLTEDDIRSGQTLKELLQILMGKGVYGSLNDTIALDTELEALSRPGALVVERRRLDGTVLEIHSNPMPNTGRVVTVTDVTARAEAARVLSQSKSVLEEKVEERTRALTLLNLELDRARKVAEDANIGKTRFLAAAGHDLLQPLNAARLFASALETQIEGDEAEGVLRRLGTSLTSLEELLSTLLDISKLDAGGASKEISRFAIRDVLDALITEFSPVAQEKNIALRVHGSALWIESDIKLLRRILQNLIGNALRYTMEGRVLIGCRRRGDTVRIDVIDTGPGIPEDKINEIFVEFSQLTMTKKDEQARQGLGLGLAIVDRLTRLLGHEIRVASHVGRGSTFSVIVPRVPEQVSAPRSKKVPSRSTSKFVARKVLVLDNEPDVLEGMRVLLVGWGCDVVTAADPDQAYEVFAHEQPELLVVDYHLDDGQTGLDAVFKIFQDFQPVPVVVATADYTEEIRERVDEFGHYLVRKPIKPAGFRALLGRLLE